MLYWAMLHDVEEPHRLGSLADLREERLADLLDFLATAARIGVVEPLGVDKAERVDDLGHSFLIHPIGRRTTDQRPLDRFRFLEDLQSAVAGFEMPLGDADLQVAIGQARLVNSVVPVCDR